MDKDELKKRLEYEGVSNSLYSLDGGLSNEKLCLYFEKDKRIVYYSERGVRTGLEIFLCEDDACKYMYHLIKSIVDGQVR